MQLLSKVKDLYNTSHIVGVGYDYTCPSLGAYPHQWLWDSCFHAIVMSNYDIDRSKKEINTLFNGQRSDGFLPCVTIWKRRFPFEELCYVNSITQPPVDPIAVEIIFNKSKDILFLKQIYPKLKKHFDWLAKNRDKNNNHLLDIRHPWEAGCDSITSFDKELGIKRKNPNYLEVLFGIYRILFFNKPFIIENVLFNSIYAKSLLSLYNLSTQLDYKEDSFYFLKKYTDVCRSLINNCWSETDSMFYDLDSNEEQIKKISVSSLMPLIIPDLPKKIVDSLIKKHLLNKDEFWLDYPIPSLPKNSESFNPNNNLVLWRGPTWINTNWFLLKALQHYGYTKEANHIKQKSQELINKSGFFEFYNPLTGEGYGQPRFGWSGLVLDM